MKTSKRSFNRHEACDKLKLSKLKLNEVKFHDKNTKAKDLLEKLTENANIFSKKIQCGFETLENKIYYEENLFV